MTNPFRMDNQETKKCTSCGEVKTLVSYSNLTGASDGKESTCRTCFNLAAQDNLDDDVVMLRVKRRAHERRLMDRELAREIGEVWG